MSVCFLLTIGPPKISNWGTFAGFSGNLQTTKDYRHNGEAFSSHVSVSTENGIITELGKSFTLKRPNTLKKCPECLKCVSISYMKTSWGYQVNFMTVKIDKSFY